MSVTSALFGAAPVENRVSENAAPSGLLSTKSGSFTSAKTSFALPGPATLTRQVPSPAFFTARRLRASSAPIFAGVFFSAAAIVAAKGEAPACGRASDSSAFAGRQTLLQAA